MAEGDASTGAGTTAAGNGDAGKTFTQAELDHIVGERLSKERAKYGDYNDLKTAAQKLAELEASQQTAAEKLTAELTTHKTAAQQAASENLRLRVAMEKKLDASLVDRLRGSTKEEIEADADKLLELVSPTPKLDGGARQTAPAGDFDAQVRAAFRR